MTTAVQSICAKSLILGIVHKNLKSNSILSNSSVGFDNASWGHYFDCGMLLRNLTDEFSMHSMFLDRHRLQGRASLHLALAALHPAQQLSVLVRFAIRLNRCSSREVTASRSAILLFGCCSLNTCRAFIS
jgi:hypothetical protein